MQVAYETLRFLSDGKFHSGTSLAEQLKVSRSSIWKGIAYLRQLELPIQAVSGRGYRWANPFELLNKQQILSGFTSYAKDNLPRIDVVNVVTSTNDYLIQRLAHDIPSGTVCIAEAQTAGKGRMGRVWRSPYGANIYCSLYWRFPCKLHDLSGLSLVSGLAVLSALKQMCPLPPELGIKWPNDIWYKDAKLCGILLESIGSSSSQAPVYTDVVIGIGMNVNMMTNDNIHSAWTNLCKVLGRDFSRNDLISALLNSIVDMFELFQQHGFAAFTSLWSHYDLLMGKNIELSSSQQKQSGVAQGVNERGELCVRLGNNLKAIRYGEVSVRPEETT
jgi:BirA family biotin operon repressor/biotin-[acetyl-CoA-carboxylase] ligase